MPGQSRCCSKCSDSRETGGSVALEAAIELFAEIFDEIRNIVAAIAQRRQRDGDHVDAIEEVGAKTAAGDFLVEQAIGGADHAGVQLLFFVIADAREMSVLQNVQQLGLQAGIYLGDFVEKQRAALRHFDASGLGGMRAGEGALLESKELAFDQRSGNGGAIYLNKGTLTPRRTLVDKAGEDFLARAALTQNQNGNIQAGGALDPLPNRLHGLRRTKIDVLRRYFNRLGQGCDSCFRCRCH